MSLCSLAGRMGKMLLVVLRVNVDGCRGSRRWRLGHTAAVDLLELPLAATATMAIVRVPEATRCWSCST